MSIWAAPASSTSISGTRLENVNLSGASIENANIKGMTIFGYDVDALIRREMGEDCH